MFKDFLSLIYPEPCFSCGEILVKGENYLCTHCLLNLPYSINTSLTENSVTAKFKGKVPIKYGISFLTFIKGGKVQKMLHSLKYKSAQDLGFYLGSEFGFSIKNKNLSTEFDYIIPIPLHPSKYKKRGFNQAEVIAKGMSASMGVPVDIISLKRVVYTETQTKKSRLERWKNVRKIFEIEGDLLSDKNILLIDDVLTTGSTMEAAVAVLLDSGIKSVSIASLAVAQ